MRCAGIVLSTSPDFNELEGVSDLYVPACGAWVGDYPYLDKIRFKAFLAERIRRGRIRQQRQRLLIPAGGDEEEREVEVIAQVIPTSSKEVVDVRRRPTD